MDKVAEFYVRWFENKPVQEYSAAKAASEELAKELIGVHESNKRDFWQTCAVKFLHGTILHLSSKAHLKGEERMTLWEVIAFLEVPLPIVGLTAWFALTNASGLTAFISD